MAQADHFQIAHDILENVTDRRYAPDEDARALALAQVRATLALAEAVRGLASSRGSSGPGTAWA